MFDSGAPLFMKDGWPRLKLSENKLIETITPLSEDNIIAMRESLVCYETYQEMI